MKRVLGILLLAALGAVGCATTGKQPSMGCLDVLSKECDDPTAYPPLTAMLPPWPFPRLIQPIEGAKK